MRRLLTVEEFAKLPETQKRDSETSVATVSVAQPEFTADGRTATFVFNTEEVARDGHVILNRGIKTDNYDKNPTILFAHDDSQPPIGRATAIRIAEPASKVDIEFTPKDLNPFGAMIGELVRAKYLNACSMSWMPLKWTLSKDKNRAGGVDFTEVDLLEISIVPIPALPSAIATARSAGIDTSPLYQWAERILDRGGMLLVPRCELEELRRAAKMPAPPRLQQTDIPENIKTRAKAVLNSHKKCAGIGQDDDDSPEERALKAKHARALARAPKVPVFKRGLYDVAQLCYLVQSLGYCHDSSEYEAELEGDDSEVPAMLGEALVTLGEALKSMAAEEVNELLDAHKGDGDEDEEAAVESRALSAEQRAHIAAGKTPRARAWRAGLAIARAGKSISATNKEKLEDADAHHERALKHSKTLGEHHDAVSGHLKEARAAHGEASQTLAEFGEHVRAAQAEPANAPEHLKRAIKAHGKAEEKMGAIANSHDDMSDRHEDAKDSHAGMERGVKSAQRYVRSVMDGAVSSEADEPEADDLKSKQAASEEKARAARAARAAALAKQHREPITLD